MRVVERNQFKYTWTRNGEVIAGANTSKIERLSAGEYTVHVVDITPDAVLNENTPCEATKKL